VLKKTTITISLLINKKLISNKFVKNFLLYLKIFISINFFTTIYSASANDDLQHNFQKFNHAISIIGSTKYPANFSQLDYVNIHAKKGGEIKFGVEGGFNSFNNFILKGIPAQGLSYIYDSLMDGVDDEIASRYGLIAKDVRFSKDQLILEFRLRKNAYFHDGKNITADDVLFSFNKLISEGHPSYKMSLKDVKNIEKINDYHVRFTFKNNNNKNLPLTIASLPILPKHFYDNHDFSKSSFDIPLGSGPYRIIDFAPNRYVIYQRVENYWGLDLPINRGRYNFDKIYYDYYRDNNVLIEAFKAQKYDFRIENIARNWANAYNIEAVNKHEIIKKEIPNNNPVPTQMFIINLRKEKFHDKTLREAINHVFDFEWLKNHIFYGSYQRHKSFFTNSIYGYQSFEMPISSGDGFNRKNLVIAQNLLLKSGYKIINNKLYDKNNNQITIEFLIDQKAFEMVVAPFIKNLKKIGIDAKMRFVEENQYQTRVNNFDFDIIVGGLPNAIIPGNELYGYLHSSQKNIKGSMNLMGLDDKIVDELVEKIARTKNINELKLLCAKLDEHLLKNHYAILQWYNDKYRILYRNIFSFPDVTPKYSLAIDSWWIKN